MVERAVPEELAAAVEGAWDLGGGYSIVVSRSGAGLRVRQTARGRLGGSRESESELAYDPEAGTLRFQGLGDVHRTLVTLRRAEGGLEHAFRSEVAPGRWTEGTWRKAERRAG